MVIPKNDLLLNHFKSFFLFFEFLILYVPFLQSHPGDIERFISENALFMEKYRKFI